MGATSFSKDLEWSAMDKFADLNTSLLVFYVDLVRHFTLLNENLGRIEDI